MTEADVAMIQELGKTIEKLAGKTVTVEVMQGSDQVTKTSLKNAVVLWVRDAMQRLDATVDNETRRRIMEHCGHTCASVNTRMIEAMIKRRQRFKDLATFFEAEQRKPMKGTRLHREGTTLYQYYTPHSFTPSMRCYCSLLRGLPKATIVSQTYCHCSKAFVQTLWEQVLQRPVKVDLLQSVISGDPECMFAIHLQ
jgi:hypothetical protein